MDGENSYESDISESWSLIDINLNEEPVFATNAQNKTEDIYSLDPKDVNLIKSDNTELEDFLIHCRDSKPNLHKCSHSDSDLLIENPKVLERNESDSSSEQDRNDSCDAESIEILDVEGNHIDSEIERLEISMIDSKELKNYAYQSDDEEPWSGCSDNKIRSTSLTVIKRKRNLKKNLESSPILNSDFVSNGNSNLRNCLSDEKKLKVFSSATSNLPVYKHYRNNVVNTALSLSMGVVFAGVACIAIGHFLGVHDASETAMELVDTLKKLQMENVVLQSRLSKLNRVVLKRDVNSKFELSSAKLHDTVPCGERSYYETKKTKTTNINYAALPEIQSNFKSIQQLTNLENTVKEEGEKKDTEIDFSALGKYIQNQINLLNNKKAEGFKLLEDSDKRISKILQKNIQSLSASQENIEKLYNKLIQLKDKVNHKMANLLPEKPLRKAPVTENDLNSIRWNHDAENSGEDLVRAFEFPKPEEFYKIRNNTDMTEEQKVTKNNNKAQKQKVERKIKEEGKKRRKREKKLKKEKSKNGEKNQKHNSKITVKKYWNESKPKKRTIGKFNETKESYRKFSKEKFEEKPKRKRKTSKAISKQNKGQHLKNKRYSRICSGNECFNLTGYWVFKYADGREEFRRHQTLSDWQFERAKGRKEKREDGVETWQFKRALARESGRNDHHEKFKKNYDSQDFFHEEFSWI